MDKIRQDKAIKIWKRDEEEEEALEFDISRTDGTASNTRSPTWLIWIIYWKKISWSMDKI